MNAVTKNHTSLGARFLHTSLGARLLSDASVAVDWTLSPNEKLFDVDSCPTGREIFCENVPGIVALGLIGCPGTGGCKDAAVIGGVDFTPCNWT